MKKQLQLGNAESILELSKKGFSIRKILNLLNIPRTTIHYHLKKVKKNNSPERKKGSGRKCILDDKIKRFIVKIIDKTPEMTSKEIETAIKNEFFIEIKSRTIRNFLKKEKFINTFAIEKPRLNDKNIKDRLAFTYKYLCFSDSDWDKMIFSDETKINLEFNDGKRKIWRKKNEGLKEKNISHTVKFKGGSVMF